MNAKSRGPKSGSFKGFGIKEIAQRNLSDFLFLKIFYFKGSRDLPMSDVRSRDRGSSEWTIRESVRGIRESRRNLEGIYPLEGIKGFAARRDQGISRGDQGIREPLKEGIGRAGYMHAGAFAWVYLCVGEIKNFWARAYMYLEVGRAEKWRAWARCRIC